MKMKSYMLPAVIALTIFGANAKNSQEGSGETDGYRLVWQDLFDEGTLRTDRWNIEVNGNGGGNNELQYYTNNEANVRVGDDGDGNGCLILTAIRENYRNKSFTSGRINSLGLTHFTHGKIEASIKMPTTNAGLWPAFWMMGNDYGEVGWPKCGETDIVEMGHATGIANGTSDRFFNGACHWGPSWPNASYAQETTKSYSVQDGEYHLFTVIWDEQYIKMYIDLDRQPKQTPYYRIDITANDPDNEWSAGNYFHKDNFIIFNLAVGGGFPNIYSADGITALNDANNQQASMYVNYVKVYQKGDDSESITMQAPGDTEDTTGVSLAENDDNTNWVVSQDFIKAVGASSITLYDLSGNAVCNATGDVISTASLASGCYVARAGNSSKKIIIK